MKLGALLTVLVSTSLGSLALAQQQTITQTIPLIAVLSTTPPPFAAGINASGTAAVYVHLVKDQTGAILSGSVDFNLNYNLPVGTQIIGITINSTASSNIAFSSGVNRVNGITTTAQTGTATYQTQVFSTDQNGLAALQDLVKNPGNYYVSVTTTANPAGILRGPLQLANAAVYLAQLSPANQVPPVTTAASSGLAAVTVLTASDSNGNVTNGQVTLTTSYTGIASGANITSLQIGNGAAGSAGSTAFDTGVSATSPVMVTNGSGTSTFSLPVMGTDATQLASLSGLANNGSNYFVTLGTTANPTGELRAQLQRADVVTFPMLLQPGKEVPPSTLNGSAPGSLTVYAVRGANGMISDAMVVFDFNPNLATPNTVTGMHIHQAPAGVSGPIVIPTPISSVPIPAGGGNVSSSVLVSSPAQLAVLNALFTSPDQFYVNIHTPDFPAGAMRDQVSDIPAIEPTVVFLGSANGDTHTSQFAPGQLIVLYGSNLTRVNASLSGFNSGTLPTSLDGTTVTIAGIPAPLLGVSNGIVVAQVPYNTPLGSQTLVLTNSAGSSSIPNVSIVPYAPVIFTNTNAYGLLQSLPLYTLLSVQPPVKAGSNVNVFATGLGQTIPPASTGSLAPGSTPFTTASVTATVNGIPATVVSSTLVSGFTGLYQTVVTIPTSLAGSGSVPVVITVGGVPSNAVNVNVY